MKKLKSKIKIKAILNENNDLEIETSVGGKLNDDMIAQVLAHALCDYVADNDYHCSEKDFTASMKKMYKKALEENKKEGEE